MATGDEHGGLPQRAFGDLTTALLATLLLALITFTAYFQFFVVEKSRVTAAGQQSIVTADRSRIVEHWSRQGLRGRILVCIDTEVDARLTEAAVKGQARLVLDADGEADLKDKVLSRLKEPVSGIYDEDDWLCAASLLGIVRQIVWVVPDRLWERAAGSGAADVDEVEGILQDAGTSIRIVKMSAFSGMTGEKAMVYLDLASGLDASERRAIKAFAADVHSDSISVVPQSDAPDDIRQATQFTREFAE